MVHDPTFTDLELRRLSRDESMGPLGHLALAYTLSAVKHPASVYFAKRGLKRVTAQALAQDLKHLYRGSGRFAEAGRLFFAALRGCADGEIDRLLKLAPAPARPALKNALTQLRADRQRPLEEALGEMFESVSVGLFKQWVTGQLQRFDRPARH